MGQFSVKIRRQMGHFSMELNRLDYCDGKRRRAKPGSPLLVTRLSSRVAIVCFGVMPVEEGLAHEAAGEDVEWAQPNCRVARHR